MGRQQDAVINAGEGVAASQATSDGRGGAVLRSRYFIHSLRFLCYAVSAFVLCFVAGCGNQVQKDAREKVRLQLKWYHQAQFAGFYLALDNGYFDEEGLDVELIEGGPDIDQAAQLLNGNADFAVTPAEMVLLRNTPEFRLVAISVIYQQNPAMFVSRKESGITSPAQFDGKRAAVGGLEKSGFIEGLVQFRALLNRFNIPWERITVLPYESNYKSFLAGEVDIIPSYLIGGVQKLRAEGIEMNLIWPGDYGVDFYADSLVTTREMINERPELVRKVLRGVLRGWRAVIANPDQALEVVMLHARKKDRQLQEWMMEAQIPMVNTGVTPVGWMEPNIWAEMYKMLEHSGLVRRPVDDLSKVQDRRFLEEVVERTEP